MRHSEKRGRIRPFRVARITRKHAFASSDDLMRRRTISPSRAGVGVFRLYLAPHELGSAVRNAYEQYKDAPLSGFRKCKEKEPCTVNVSEKLPRNTSPSRSIHAKSFNTHHSFYPPTAISLGTQQDGNCITIFFRASCRTGLVRF